MMSLQETTTQRSPMPAAEGRTKRLKAATNETHDRLDHSIMDAEPFASRERYGLFVRIQHQFHSEILALYDAPPLTTVLTDLTQRCRFRQIEDDLADLGIAVPEAPSSPAFEREADIDLPTALGWLYVAEGSNLGAAFLLKAAHHLGLSETFGARHLAAAPEGRGSQWKSFTAALDAIELTSAEEERVVAGASAAFARVRDLVARGLKPAAAA